MKYKCGELGIDREYQENAKIPHLLLNSSDCSRILFVDDLIRDEYDILQGSGCFFNFTRQEHANCGYYLQIITNLY